MIDSQHLYIQSYLDLDFFEEKSKIFCAIEIFEDTLKFWPGAEPTVDAKLGFPLAQVNFPRPNSIFGLPATP